MKKHYPLLLALILCTLPALGQVTINVELGSGTAVSGTDVAGVVPSAGWQQKSGYPDVTTPSALNLSDGSSSGASITFDGTGNVTSIGAATTDANYTMFNRNLGIGFAGSGNTNGSLGSTISVTGLGTDFTTNGYDVYVYVATNTNFGSGGEDIETVSMSDGTTTYYFEINDTIASYQGSFIQATATDLASAGLANYVKFSGLTSSSFTISSTPVTVNADSLGGFAGMQIVAVPEPGTFALLAGFGALGLILVRRRVMRARA